MIVSQFGKIICIESKSICAAGRRTQGVKLLELEPQDKVAAPLRLAGRASGTMCKASKKRASMPDLRQKSDETLSAQVRGFAKREAVHLPVSQRSGRPYCYVMRAVFCRSAKI